MAFETESEYYSKLTYEAKRRYKKKLTMENGENIPDPFCIKQEQWIDDPKLWPNVEYGDIYNYLIETKGLFTKESLKAYKSLEAFNLFHSEHVRTVYYFEGSSASTFTVLIAKVNPSQKSPNNSHEAWVVLKKQVGTVITGHCTCMAG